MLVGGQPVLQGLENISGILVGSVPGLLVEVVLVAMAADGC